MYITLCKMPIDVMYITRYNIIIKGKQIKRMWTGVGKPKARVQHNTGKQDKRE